MKPSANDEILLPKVEEWYVRESTAGAHVQLAPQE
jgi:hypothetical protein